MLIETCALIGCGIGAIIGAIAETSPKGKEVNANLQHSYDSLKKNNSIEYNSDKKSLMAEK